MGIGAVWNVMDVGQQFTMHVVVTAGLLGLVVLAHLGLIRRPAWLRHPATNTSRWPMASSSVSTMSRKPRRHAIRHWTGPERKFDLLFEGTVGVLVVSVLVVAASIIFGSANGGLTYPGGPPSKPGRCLHRPVLGHVSDD